MSHRNTRRDFIKSTALAGVGVWVAGSARAEEKAKSANDKINFACIGISGKGSSDTADAAQNGNIAAICDVDENSLGKAGELYPNAKKYTDFRKMLEEMGAGIDAVTVSTPDHCHAAASAMAMRMGKHCFTQKPLTKTIYEARKLGEIANEMKVATMMGNQGTANTTLREAAAALRAGAVGKVQEVHVWTNRPIWPQGGARPEAAAETPKHVHWDLWLGPAPYRPYAAGYHPFAWRGWWDFGTGALGDMACHTVNMPYMGLELRDPTSVQAEHSGHNGDSYPNWSIINYDFPANDWRPACKMVWYDGGKKVSPDLLEGEKLSDSGVLVIGDKGKMYAPGDYCENGHKMLGGADDPDVDIESSPGHFAEWIRAIRGGQPAKSNFVDYAGPLTETILLGNLAIFADKTGKENVKVEWDAKNIAAKNAPQVADIIKYDYREGYTL
ncbi:MAG: Gfo/Idh/MocA family protein [Pirellulales bacterium]